MSKIKNAKAKIIILVLDVAASIRGNQVTLTQVIHKLKTNAEFLRLVGARKTDLVDRNTPNAKKIIKAARMAFADLRERGWS
jgi:hypothetical protein